MSNQLTYKCTLVQTVRGKSLVKECFYRKGESAQDVKEGLEMFDYGNGTWRIELPDFDYE